MDGCRTQITLERVARQRAAFPEPVVDERAELRSFVDSGDAVAFTRILRRWEARLFRLAYRVTADRGVAEDVVQTVFFRIVDRRSELDGVERFAAWVQRATINESINAVRRSRRREARSADVGRHAARARGDRSDPIESIAHAEECEHLRRALERLPLDTRALLALRFDEDLTFRSIAEVLGRPVSTVKSQTERAIRALRSALKHETNGGVELP